MAFKHLEIAVQIPEPAFRFLTLNDIPPEISVLNLIRLILERAGMPYTEDWKLRFGGIELPSGGSLGDMRFGSTLELVGGRVPINGNSIALTLTREPLSILQTSASCDAATAAPSAFGGIDLPDLRHPIIQELIEADTAAPSVEDWEFSLCSVDGAADVGEAGSDIAFDECPSFEAPESPLAAAPEVHGAGPAAEPQSVQRRATVRYFTRMNPERVYPLLVMITREMIENTEKKDVGQKVSDAFSVDTEAPLEIAPILPGCDCYPPRMSVRLGRADLAVTFRVVPRVLGAIDGAEVRIRQEHQTLASIQLELRVVKQTWVLCSGGMTFLLPGASAVFQHFGVDFTGGKEASFSPYLAAVRLIFDTLPPAALTAFLGTVTGVLWWLAKPKSRDTFWDIEKVGPALKLQRIQKALTEDAKNQEAAEDLLALLRAFPDFQPAQLFCSAQHYARGNFRAAFEGFERGLKLGRGGPRTYYFAALSASHLGENRRALEFLEEAERLLPASEITGPMLYNMACYHMRLGHADAAIEYLTRAIAAGYTKRESFRIDPDLAPLRSRPDFKKLMAALGDKPNPGRRS